MPVIAAILLRRVRDTTSAPHEGTYGDPVEAGHFAKDVLVDRVVYVRRRHGGGPVVVSGLLSFVWFLREWCRRASVVGGIRCLACLFDV